MGLWGGGAVRSGGRKGPEHFLGAHSILSVNVVEVDGRENSYGAEA